MIDYIALEKYGRELSVLFVEDDEGISKEMNFLLGDIFTKVDSGFDGIEGLSKYNQYFQANEKYYDLLITDIRMPNMNGIELIKNIETESVHLILSDIPYGISFADWDILHDNTNSALGGSSPAQHKTGSGFKMRGKPINGNVS